MIYYQSNSPYQTTKKLQTETKRRFDENVYQIIDCTMSNILDQLQFWQFNAWQTVTTTAIVE